MPELNLDDDVMLETDLQQVFVLTGPKSGKTGNYGGRTFIKGKTTVLKADAELLSRILSRGYAAYPIEQCSEKDGVWSKNERGATPAPTPGTTPDAPTPPDLQDSNHPELESKGMDDLRSMAA